VAANAPVASARQNSIKKLAEIKARLLEAKKTLPVKNINLSKEENTPREEKHQKIINQLTFIKNMTDIYLKNYISIFIREH
jgi:hypothetical protein